VRPASGGRSRGPFIVERALDSESACEGRFHWHLIAGVRGADTGGLMGEDGVRKDPRARTHIVDSEAA